MSKKIEISGKALLVTDTVSGLVELSQPSVRTWYKEIDLKIGRISFYDLDSTEDVSGNLSTIVLGDAVDSGLVAFTESTFRTFCLVNLGFNPGSSSSTTALTTKTADYTALSTDETILLDGNANTVTLDLPTAVGIQAKIYIIVSIDSTFQTDINPNGTETINDVSANKILAATQRVSIQSDGANWVIIGI